MATRRDAREWAVQLLFQLDINPSEELGDVFCGFWAEHPTDPKSRRFVEGRVTGVRKHINEIDDMLQKFATNWKLERMPVTDRNVLRLALFEMRFCSDVPPVVVINEAVDLAKYFNNTESGRFVNGVLDRARAEIDAMSH